MIYLDYNATAPLLPEVTEAMRAFMGVPHNPSSVHGYGRKARAVIEEVRGKVAGCVGAEGYEVVFTGGGTEANNLALNGLAENITHVVSAVEHVSVLKNAKAPRVVPVDENGIVRLDALEAMLKNIEGGALVSVMLANNETGVIQPVREIAEIVFRHGGYVHCDASQAVGKIPVDMMALGVDILTISAHKFGGPQGVGALIVKKGMGLSSLQKGGGQERGYRAGTENVAGIVGFGVALSRRHPPSFTKKNYRGIHLDGCNEEEGWPYSSAVRNSGHDVELRNKLEHAITSFAPGAVVFGEKANRLPNTSCIAMPGVSGETQVIDFDLKGFAVSSGAACSSGKVEVSHVLLAMGVEKELAASAIRVSLGYATAEAEIDAFIKAWQALYERTRGRRIAA